MISVILLSLFVAFLVFMFQRKRSALPHIPGPPTIPLLGNVLQLGPRMEIELGKLSKKYGPVFKINLLNKTVVILSSYEAIYEAFVKRSFDFAGRPSANNFRAKCTAQNKGIAFAQPGPSFHSLRKICHRQMNQVDKDVKVIDTVAEEIFHELVQKIKAVGSKPLNPKAITHTAALCIITHLSMGRVLPEQNPLFNDMTKLENIATALVSPSLQSLLLNSFPFLRHFGVPEYKKILEFLRVRETSFVEIRNFVTEHSEDEEVRMSILFAMLQEVQQPDCSFDELDVKVAIPNLLIAGVGTFSHFFLYFMNVMANNQGVLRKVQDEIDLVMDNGRSLSNIHKDGMPYTYATQMELTRYLSLTPMGLPHATLRDTSIAQFHLPEGTEIMANLWHLHHDEDFWDAPFEFKPERFLDEQGKLLSSSHPNRKHVMAYGAGQRVCLGEAMGKIHLFAYCAIIARNFNIKSGPQVVTCDPRDFIPGAVIEMPDFELVFESRL